MTSEHFLKLRGPEYILFSTFSSCKVDYLEKINSAFWDLEEAIRTTMETRKCAFESAAAILRTNLNKYDYQIANKWRLNWNVYSTHKNKIKNKINVFYRKWLKNLKKNYIQTKNLVLERLYLKLCKKVV